VSGSAGSSRPTPSSARRRGDGRDPDYKWVIDPIDGTKSFIHGVPLYGTLIGVEVRGRPAVGVVYLPATDEMVAAADGLGCTWNGRRRGCPPSTGLTRRRC